MAIGKEIKVVLTLDDKGFKVGIRDANGTLQQLAQQAEQAGKSIKNTENHFTSFGHKAHSVIMTMGMARFALMDLRDIFLSFPLAILKSSGEIERLTKLMEGLSKESLDAKKKLEAAANVKFLFNMAQNAPFEVKALGDAFVKLKTGGIDPLNGSLAALVNGVAKFGGSSEELKRAAIAIQQMGGKGVVSMEELRQQLGEAVPSAMAAMAEGMGMSMAELTKKVSTGTVGAQVAIGKMLAVMGLQNAGAAAAMMDTWVGLMEQLKTKWELFKVDIGGEGLFKGAKEAVKELMGAFGTDSAASAGRAIGRAMNDALVTVVKVTKSVVEMWDTIVLAGKAWAVYWAATKLAVPAQSMIDKLKDTRLAIIAKRDASVLAAADEIATAQRSNAAQIAQFQERIRANEALIAEERKRVAAQKAADAERVAATIKANQAEIAAAREKAAQLALIEQEIRMRSMATALEAEKVARSKRAGSGADARRMMGDAAGLANNADLLARERQAILSNAAAIGARNTAMQRQVELAAISTNVTNGTISTLNQTNNALRQVVAQHEAQARAITSTTTALSTMRAAGVTALGWMKNMIFSMNGLVIAIMAAVWAWDAFSEASKKAAREAKTALEMRDRLRQGTANIDDNKDLENVIKGEEKKLAGQQARLANLREMRKTEVARGLSTADVDQRIKEAEKEEWRLLSSLSENRANLAAGVAKVTRDQSEITARNIATEVQRGAAKVAEEYVKANQKIDEALSKGDKLPKTETEKLNKEKLANDLKALEAQKTFLRAKADEYATMAKDAGLTKEKALAYTETAKLLEKEIGNANQQIVALNRPDQIIEKDKKGPKTKPTDAIINRLHSEQLGLLHAKQILESLNSDAADANLLKQQAQQEVDLLLANDMHVVKVHTPEQEKELVETITQKKVIDEAARELRDLKGKLPALLEEVKDLEERAATGNTNKSQSKAENSVIKTLKKMAETSVEAREALKLLEPAIDQVTEAAARKDIATFIIENEKRLKELRVASIVDTRERILAEGEQEVADIKKKYDEQLKSALKHNGDIIKIGEMRTAELKLQAEKQARALETPLDKLARDWRNGYEQMNQATAKWSQGFMDALREMLVTGRGDWKKFLSGMLADVLDMQLKKSFGDQISGMFSKAGDWLKGQLNLGVNASVSAAAPAASAVAGQVAAPAVADAAAKASAEAMQTLAKTTEVASGAMTNVSTDGLTQMATSTALSAARTTANTAVDAAAGSMIAEMGLMAQLTSDALTTLALAAYDAAAAQGAEMAGSFFANGGIMSSMGSLPLKKYANGGIADRPQLAVFGEGAMNEAYVPLPDGRSIPVTMKMQGGSEGGQQVAPAVTVNVINQSGQQVTAQRGDTRFDGRKMILDVVLTAANQPGPFRSGMQQALK